MKIYDLKDDKKYIITVQDASINRQDAGLKQTYGLFGSKEWWNAIENGNIPKIFLSGVITKVFMSGHNDFPEATGSKQRGQSLKWEID